MSMDQYQQISLVFGVLSGVFFFLSLLFFFVFRIWKLTSHIFAFSRKKEIRKRSEQHSTQNVLVPPPQKDMPVFKETESITPKPTFLQENLATDLLEGNRATDVLLSAQQQYIEYRQSQYSTQDAVTDILHNSRRTELLSDEKEYHPRTEELTLEEPAVKPSGVAETMILEEEDITLMGSTVIIDI